MSANGGETGVLLRFLRARKLNVSKALAMFRETLEWRAAEDVDALMRAPLVLDEFRECQTLPRVLPARRPRQTRGIERTGTAKFAEVIRRIGADGSSACTSARWSTRRGSSSRLRPRTPERR